MKKIQKKIREYFNRNPMPENRIYISSDYDKNGVDIISIAFNEVRVIEYQIKLIKKNLLGAYTFIVCDNSTDENFAKQIYEVCKNNDITYFRVLLRRPYDEMLSHGSALNWAFKNIIEKRKNNFFFIDFDIFPMSPVDVSKFTTHNIYGTYRKRQNDEHWYLWPGFSYFNYDFIKNKKLNFLPPPDAGGSNYARLFKYIDKDNLEFPNHRLVNIINNTDLPDICVKYRNDSSVEITEEIRQYFRGDFYTDCVEYLDDNWLHFRYSVSF